MVCNIAASPRMIKVTGLVCSGVLFSTSLSADETGTEESICETPSLTTTLFCPMCYEWN